MSEFYIPRTLLIEDKKLSEKDLLAEASVIVVLAEPGAGKTDLLNHIAGLLGVRPIRASIFKHQTSSHTDPFLVLDGMDEVARIDRLSTDAIIVRASETQVQKVIFAGRSSEWDNGSFSVIEDSFHQKPTIVHLQPFSGAEQRQLFEREFPEEDFDLFSEEAKRFELTPLLGNPQFLQLFGEAYIQSDRRFTSKAQIFSDAVQRLAYESNPKIGRQSKPSVARIIEQADEIFAKLILSGAAGISSVESLQDVDFPYLDSLCDPNKQSPQHLLDTRLFKPASNADQHEPVHRIVLEYCAARYLVSRATDASDRLTLDRLLAVVAPNGIVRDELRGLVGWMAALGSKEVQTRLIDLDPYAVLANGDPAQLHHLSKHLLIDRLQTLSRDDPYFRRSDRWRSFNVGQFFKGDVVEKLRPLLSPESVEPSLIDLFLELLPGTEAADELHSEIKAILLDESCSSHTRQLAVGVLLDLKRYDLSSDVSELIAECSKVSLRCAAAIIAERDPENFGEDLLASLLRAACTLYPTGRTIRDHNAGSRYFVLRLIKTLSEPVTVRLLDELTYGLRCTCTPKRAFECRCRVGISKIVGKLLDHYFEVKTAQAQPERLWSWTRNLHFSSQGSSSRSAAIRALKEDSVLRQGIHKVAFSEAQTAEEAQDIASKFYFSPTHSGLRFQQEDRLKLAQSAFDDNKPFLWAEFRSAHNLWSKHQPTELRRLMRGHANSNREFMRLWAKQERAATIYRRENRSDISNRTGRYERREKERIEKQRAYLEENREHIEAGRHFGWLKVFGQRYLMGGENPDQDIYDKATAEAALRNCFSFLSGHIPELADLAAGRGDLIARILHSACVVHFRDRGSLDHIEHKILVAARTDIGGYSGFEEGEAEAFEAELDRILFPTLHSAEAFAREFIEPTLGFPRSGAAVGWLNHNNAFKGLRETLPLEWLRSFPNIHLTAVQSLFDMASEHGDRQDLLSLIEARAKAPLVLPGTNEEDDKHAKDKHSFWQLRAFLYLPSPPPDVWDDFSTDPDSIFALNSQLGNLISDERVLSPPLSAEKVYKILDAYVDAWPKVQLPSSWGTGSPKGETAYRFLCFITQKIEGDLPERSIAVIDRILADSRFYGFRKSLLTQRASAYRKLGLKDFQPPSPAEVCRMLDDLQIASVEDLRVLVLEELKVLQTWLRGSETNPIETFYDAGKRVDENTARNRIVDRLESRMEALSLSVIIERHMADSKRCDFTAETTLSGRKILLPVEVKGQWHGALFSAAKEQLETRYSIHPDAANQGIYLVLWYGPDEKVASKKNTTLKGPAELKAEILKQMPLDLQQFIDVYVLDLSRP